jgi:hypothetical protein
VPFTGVQVCLTTPAVALGVQAHHWRFGNMLAIEGLTRGDVTMIITYIRELQRANGIN